MPPRRPQHESDQDHEGPGLLVHDRRGAASGVPHVAAADVQADAREDPGLHDAQDVEEPDAEGDPQRHQVAHADDRKIEAKGHPHLSLEQAEGTDHGQGLNAVVVGGEGVPGVQQQGHDEPQPHQPASQQGADEAPGLPRVPGHGQRQARKRKEQPLVPDPLAAQQHRQAEDDPVEDGHEGHPRGKGEGPGRPGKGHALGKSLVEELHGLGVRGRHPRMLMLREQRLPVVLGAGVVHGPGDDRQEVAGETGDDGRTDQHHPVDGDHLGGGEGQPVVERSESRHDHGGHGEEEQDGDDGDGATGELRSLDHEDRPGAEHVNHPHQHRAAEHRARRHSRGLTSSREHLSPCAGRR